MKTWSIKALSTNSQTKSVVSTKSQQNDYILKIGKTISSLPKRNKDTFLECQTFDKKNDL